ncbi:hypothetical protein PRSY57_0902300 [Plasmodium reichenowi]|uniref:Uncharacterized protein n=1 Tax=Plasmodium reichenowi TaxID=5854 RepID=A0A151LH77_PLARE|nr:hypothetical protein PRSY57_0902300 [Plasmodium reichenowi]KYN98328.1 hypothetical protein PRSY57_0902300 [Plasmodium reichenowi]
MNYLKLFLFLFLVNILNIYGTPLFYNKNLEKWNKELLKISKKEYNSLNELNELTDRKNCGKSLKHLAGLILDKSDKEAKLIIEGSIIFNKLILKLGNIKEKEIKVNDIILPIETLSNKCINIRVAKSNDSTILCLANKVLRNFWANSITDAVLCKMTNVQGKLPEYDYTKHDEDNDEDNDKDNDEENDEDNEMDMQEKEANSQNRKVKKINEKKKKIINEEFDDEQEKEQKGLKLRIAKSKYGQPNIKINEKSLEDIKKDQLLKNSSRNEQEAINLQKENSEEDSEKYSDME